MYVDLNVTIPAPAIQPQKHGQSSKKSKGKQQQAESLAQPTATVAFNAAQLAKIESRIDLLVRLGYTVLALTQNAVSKVDTKTHTNTLDALLPNLRKREGVLFLKRLTIELDNESEKGFGLTQAATQLFSSYDIIALRPTTPSTLSLACLSHTTPSPLTAHIISIPLTSPQTLRLKHTLVRTAIKNGAVFEIDYSGALEDNDSERRNWWAGAREMTRVTKGKSLVLSSGTESCQLLRAPRDAGNLLTLAGLAQDQAHHAATSTPKSLILRAQTRKTYRAILSEPKLIMPETNFQSLIAKETQSEMSVAASSSQPPESPPPALPQVSENEDVNPHSTTVLPVPPPQSSSGAEKASSSTALNGGANGKKRSHDQLNLDELETPTSNPQNATSKNLHPPNGGGGEGSGSRKRKKKGKDKT
ncbi:PHP domain-like protein [Schizopora paradoxa]|uniref:PHP domain-like protein n=1 Tax=Schizopora paradoxa TaxID=27342 RepID=A0A0H2RL02_9AGAM|nr:PHP domain-like protein [Schizopora paradoxa]